MALQQPADLTIDTDASQRGWGAISSCASLTSAGWWQNKGGQHINELELRAVWKACLAFEHHLSNKTILFRSDNVTTMAYLNKMGGRNPRLNRLLRRIINWAEAHNMAFLVVHVAGVVNGPADYLSWLYPQHKWVTGLSLFHELEWKWGPHSIDCFATAWNALLQRFNSQFHEPQCEVVDTFLQDWREDNNWVAPPIAVIPRVIHLVRRQGAMATIIAPVWRGCRWWNDLLELTVDQPFEIRPNAAAFVGEFGVLPEPLRNKKWRWMAFWICGKTAPAAGVIMRRTC